MELVAHTSSASWYPRMDWTHGACLRDRLSRGDKTVQVRSAAEEPIEDRMICIVFKAKGRVGAQLEKDRETHTRFLSTLLTKSIILNMHTNAPVPEFHTHL
mmetsp:Transcript_26091/g.34791  ORF Transcript_26091/g.34791 Transcript_26091/m.34791 type:complete len:101 (+) Transcript_26091:1725-2027(+)